MDEVAVDIDERGLAGLFVDDVAVPNLLVESFRSGHRQFERILALWKGSRQSTVESRKRPAWREVIGKVPRITQRRRERGGFALRTGERLGGELSY